ncbi:MAG: hypothetical protein H0U49_02555 [Parachlamydiaceae bacterium]|nr:hypothetical protein [Parachlamydiaceae bacterium]
MERSKRFKSGNYYATCMQPLFHKSQLVCHSDKIASLSIDKNRFQSLKETRIGYKEGNVFTKIVCFISLFFDPLANIADKSLDLKLKEINKAIKSCEKDKKKYKFSADKCSKYAIRAILDQNCCDFKHQCVKTEADVKCCAVQLYKSERICGCLHKIDCCAQRCWAMNCLGCICCIWPAGRTYCVI